MRCQAVTTQLYTEGPRYCGCHHQARDGEDYCYYHGKMERGLIAPNTIDLMCNPLVVENRVTGEAIWRANQ